MEDYLARRAKLDAEVINASFTINGKSYVTVPTSTIRNWLDRQAAIAVDHVSSTRRTDECIPGNHKNL